MPVRVRAPALQRTLRKSYALRCIRGTELTYGTSENSSSDRPVTS